MGKKVNLNVHDITDYIDESDSIKVVINVSYKGHNWLLEVLGTLSQGLDKQSAWWPSECDREFNFTHSNQRMPPAAIRELGKYIDKGTAFKDAMKTSPRADNLYHLKATRERLLSEFDGCIDKKNKINTLEHLLRQAS